MALLAAAVAVTASVSLIGSPSDELGRDGCSSATVVVTASVSLVGSAFGEQGRYGCSAAALQLSASHDFMGISETILLSQYDAE